MDMSQQQFPVQHATVLVVEDDPDTRNFLQQMLGMEGYNTLLAASGADALDMLKQRQVDLMLLDLMLPDVSGYELCQQVRRSDNALVPIMILSALKQPHDVAQGLQTGADDYVRKPFLSEELLLRMQNLLRRRQETLSMQHEVQRLQQASATESLLRHEFLHNVATHMQALCGIVDAETRKLPPSPERDTVQRIRSRVHGAALVYQTSETLATDPVPMGTLIRTITKALKNMYRPWKRVLLDVTGDDVHLPNNVAALLAIVVNELTTNCFKHAFPQNSFGKIDVVYGVEDTTFLLKVSDNGVGFDTNTAKTGAGRATIAQLVQGINGSVCWQSSDKGTRVDVRVPLTSEYT